MAIRIGGLASGMDIDTLVSDLMKAERLPLNKLSQKRQTLEWQRDDYREMNTLMKDLDRYIADNMILQKDILKKTVVSSDSSVVSATANTAAAKTTNTISVSNIAKSATWVSENPVTYTPPTADLQINLKVTSGAGTTSDTLPMTIKAGSSIKDVLSTLSNNKSLGISAFYDEQQGKVVISKTDTGSASKITLADQNAKDIFASLGFTYTTVTDAGGTPIEDNLDFGTEGRIGENAEFTINGYTTERASNTFTMNDVNYTLHKEGTATNPASANITISNDTDNMVDKIVQFVNKYNEMIEKINGKIGATSYRDYKPLSDEEKEGMTEKQIELWEEKAKSGLLRNDSILSGALTQFRMDFYNPLTGTGVNSNLNQLAEIGIKTTSNYSDRGKLSIDESKLREAVAKDPEAVFQLFNASGTTADEQGILKRIRKTMSNTVGSIEKKAGRATYTNQQFSIGRNISQLDSDINRFEDRLMQIENRYWRQFTAMEKAIQKSNSQSMYLMQQFSM